jgi:hypothetical protein
MSPATVKQKCVECSIIFERSKFNPYLDRCEKHRTNSKGGKKVSEQKPKKISKKEKEVIPEVVLPLPSATNFKKVVITIEKEKIFVHLLTRGWKLSSNNKLFKTTDKVKVIATLGVDGSPSQKFSASFWGGDKFSGFDGSMTIVERAQLKKLPSEITDDLEDIVNLIWPEEEDDAKTND